MGKNSPMSDPAVLTATSREPVIYEQPLSERMRTFLRLEFLYHQALSHAEHEGSWASRAAVQSLLEILAILSRGDLRNEVLKELERHAINMGQLQTRQGVDTGRLQSVLKNLMELREQLNSCGAHYSQRLKENEFLSAIKHRSAIPGGTCEFDLPEYSHWLRQPYPDRLRGFENWMEDLRPLCDSIAELLWLTRQTSVFTEKEAVGGLYQQTMERGSNHELVRIALSPDTNLFPEVSGGSHRVIVRFLSLSEAGGRAQQSSEAVTFRMSCI
jgi:cell division protein ZapD